MYAETIQQVKTESHEYFFRWCQRFPTIFPSTIWICIIRDGIQSQKGIRHKLLMACLQVSKTLEWDNKRITYYDMVLLNKFEYILQGMMEDRIPSKSSSENEHEGNQHDGQYLRGMTTYYNRRWNTGASKRILILGTKNKCTSSSCKIRNLERNRNEMKQLWKTWRYRDTTIYHFLWKEKCTFSMSFHYLHTVQ